MSVDRLRYSCVLHHLKPSVIYYNTSTILTHGAHVKFVRRCHVWTNNSCTCDYITACVALMNCIFHVALLYMIQNLHYTALRVSTMTVVHYVQCFTPIATTISHYNGRPCISRSSTTNKSDFLIGDTSCNTKPSPTNRLSRVAMALQERQRTLAAFPIILGFENHCSSNLSTT